MILGQWSSAAFLRYIWPQVMEWTAEMSLAMLHNPDFCHADPATSLNMSSSTTWTPGNVDALQVNIEAAIKNPEATQFNGSCSDTAFETQLNLEFCDN
ncbi:hypothetical protein ACA910_000882 [Epithemia clementina (nom. ined.)]